MTLPPQIAGEAGESSRGAEGAGPTDRGEPGSRLGGHTSSTRYRIRRRGRG